MRKFAYGLIALGLLVLAFPYAREWYYEREQAKLLAAIERSMAEETAAQEAAEQAEAARRKQMAVEYERLSAILEREAEPAAPDNDRAAEEPAIPDGAIAIIEIDKIGVKLPVLEGATQKNMRAAAAHMTETSTIGDIGNAAIAAHRAKTKGRLFNRLGEMEIGDEIVIRQDGERLDYTVYDISIVEPTDLSVLDGNDRDSLLTLITCDPLVNPTHRLIVHAKLQAEG